MQSVFMDSPALVRQCVFFGFRQAEEGGETAGDYLGYETGAIVEVVGGLG